MLMDMAAYLVLAIHDLPGLHMDVNLFSGTSVNNFFVLIILMQWYTQLFLLLVLSVIHAVAVFYPARFRLFSSKHVKVIIVIIIVVDIGLAVPLFTGYCGFYYSVDEHFWTFDPDKPYSYIYFYCNLLIQGVCVVIVVCVDVLIIWKLRKHRVRSMLRVRKTPTVAAPFSQPKHVQEVRVSNEQQLAFNFILLSACFLTMTIFYNIDTSAFLYGSMTALTYNLNNAKWSLYVLGNRTIRGKLRSLFPCG
ncbi:hypothetical protein GCK32_002049 [Trichostrongylus colubriformis]|uniref:7TM GPCR serpentine receptor class x (Srx) domain-containing protein n=1 Tax=Trichostrongylus colubriformis TaxID=6319 RepID=A0AAN8FFM9_TRICO